MIAEILARNPDFWGILLTGGGLSLAGFIVIVCLIVPNRYSVPFVTWLARIENFPTMVGPAAIASLGTAVVMLGIAGYIAFQHVSVPSGVWVLLIFGVLGTIIFFTTRRRRNAVEAEIVEE